MTDVECRRPVMPVFHSPAYNDVTSAFDTFAKADAVAAAIDDPRINLVEPRPATFNELAAVHTRRYLHAVLTGEPEDLAASNGVGWDPQLFDAVAASTGGLRDAALAALSSGGNAGSLSSGLHHAKVDRGDGYCTVNGLVVAARAALRAGAARVLVLDVDAHCGGGTAQLIDCLDGVEQVDVSTSTFDRYPSRPDARLSVVDDTATYLEVVEAELAAVEDPASIDLVLHNAGVDPHEHAGGRPGVTTDTICRRESMVYDWAATHRIPVAFTLAGGYTSATYDLDDVARLHLITVTTAADPEPCADHRA